MQEISVSAELLRSIWNSLELGLKVRRGQAAFEPQPRYLSRPETQVGTIRLPNGWIIGVAHRWRTGPSDEWSLPDPKRIWIDDVSLYLP